MRRFGDRRAWFIAGACGVGLSLLLFPVPLLDGLTYEFSVLVGVVGFAAAFAVGSAFARTLASPYGLRWKLLDPGPRERLEQAVVRTVAIISAGTLSTMLVPAAHGAWLGCAFERGLPIFLLTTLPAVVLGSALGVFARVWAPDSRVLRFSIAIAFVLISVVLTLREVLFGPLAIFHNLVIGQVAATGYLGFDDSVRFPSDQILHRAVTIVVASLLLALAWARAATRAARGTERRSAGAVGENAAAPDESELRRALLLTDEARSARGHLRIALLVLALMAATGDPFGLGTGRSRVERALSGTRTAGGVTLRFRPGSRVEGLAPVLLEDAQWALARMYRDLALPPAHPASGSKPVTLFVYDSGSEQSSLTGAAGYLFAKPWLGEIHTRLDEGGEVVALRHELAHVVAASFGLPALGVSARYGLIEGLAEAVGADYASRRWRHEPAAAALAKGLLPPADRALSTFGFALHDAEVSYLAAASFAGWLLHDRGPERFRGVYAWGNFEQIYGEPLSALDSRWREFLSTIPVEASSLTWAARAFDVERNPPFFRRNCARVGVRAPDREADCDVGGQQISGAASEQESSRLDALAASGSFAAREQALVQLALHHVREGRLELAADALGRRVHLAMIAGRDAPMSAAAAGDPALVPFWLAASGSLEPGALDAFVVPDPARDSEAAAVIGLSAALVRPDGPAILRARASVVGGCAARFDLTGTPQDRHAVVAAESRLLLRASRALLIANDRDAALRAARVALANADLDADLIADCQLAIERAGFAGGQLYLNESKNR